MVRCVIFDTGNENYKETHRNLPIDRTHWDKQKTSYRYLVQFFKERSVKTLKYVKIFFICEKTYQDMYKGYLINFEHEHVARHSPVWQTYKVHICVVWFKTSWKSMEQALYGE